VVADQAVAAGVEDVEVLASVVVRAGAGHRVAVGVAADVDALVGAVADERALDRVAVGAAQVDAVSHAMLEVAVVEDLHAGHAAVARVAQLDAVVEAGDLAVLDERAGRVVQEDYRTPARCPSRRVGRLRASRAALL
jgi:hypothetical protein